MNADLEYDPRKHNVYADNIMGFSIHISEAESGQKGYFCQGCKKELQAVRHKVPNRMDFFRHKAIDVQIERKCVYSDQTYRHILAKEILARIKHIRVPAVYKYPPKGTEGMANLLIESVLVEAHSLQMERSFFENEQGEIKWGSAKDVDERYLLVRPDVVFFDLYNNPILFIELVATHKVDNEKKAKLRRLGINAIEIIIPRDAPSEIEAAFYNTKHIKWIYNHVAESTKYISIPVGNSKGIPPIDEQQKRFFAETYECRQAEVRNLIRSITRVLESKQFGEIAKRTGEELSRVKGNTEGHRTRLDGLREEYRNRAIKLIEPKEEEFKKEYDEFAQQQADFQHYSWELETRYFAKRSALNNEQISIDRITKGESQPGGDIDSRIGERRREIERIRNELQQNIRKEESEIAGIEREEVGLPERYKLIRESTIERFSTLQRNEVSEAEVIEREQAEHPNFLESEESALQRDFEGDKEKLREEFERTGEQLNQIAMSEDGKGTTQLHFRIRGLLEARELLNDIGQAQSHNRRNRKAWESFKDGSYQNWME